MMNSEPTIKFRGVIKQGHRVYYKPGLHADRLRMLEGKEFFETIEEVELNVTPDQHGYYRSCIRFLINETEAYAGWEEKELHGFFAEHGLGYKVQRTWTGRTGTEVVNILIIPSTSEISKKRMSEYINWFVAFVADQGIVLPDPTDVVTRKYSSRTKKDVKGENSELSENR